MNPIQQVRKWGCVLPMILAACCVIPEGAPCPAPAEVQQALVQQHSDAIKRTQTDFPAALHGGPGFTRETAWKILLKERRAVSFEYLVLGRLNLGELQMQSLVEEKGRYYDVHYIHAEHDGRQYIVEQWFDITPYFRKL